VLYRYRGRTKNPPITGLTIDPPIIGGFFIVDAQKTRL